MFTVAEGWLPSQGNLELVEKHGSALIKRFPDEYAGFVGYLGFHKARLAFDVDYAQRYLPARCHILEIGASPYFATLPLRDVGFRLTALDKAAVVEATLEGTDICMLRCDLDRDQIPTADNSFDAIVFNEVIEHLRYNLIHSVGELYRVLKPGGKLLMSTPNLRSLAGLYNLIFKGEAWACMGDGIYAQFAYLEGGGMGHIREYTPTEMINFFERIGFEIEGVIYRGGYSGALWHYFTKVRPEFKPFFSLVCSKPM